MSKIFGRFPCEKKLEMLHCFVNSKMHRVIQQKLQNLSLILTQLVAIKLCSIQMNESGDISMLNHKQSICILYHLFKLQVPDQPAETEWCVKFVALWKTSIKFFLICNQLRNFLVPVVGKYCWKRHLVNY